MSITGLDAFDASLNVTHVWLKDLMQELGWEDRQRAYHALRAVLHALRDRLTVDEAAQLAAQLPLLIRGVYYEGWDPSNKPLKERHRDAFLAHVDRNFGWYLAAKLAVDPSRSFALFSLCWQNTSPPGRSKM